MVCGGLSARHKARTAKPGTGKQRRTGKIRYSVPRTTGLSLRQHIRKVAPTSTDSRDNKDPIASLWLAGSISVVYSTNRVAAGGSLNKKFNSRRSQVGYLEAGISSTGQVESNLTPHFHPSASSIFRGAKQGRSVAVKRSKPRVVECQLLKRI